jgi:hypothetical protein
LKDDLAALREKQQTTADEVGFFEEEELDPRRQRRAEPESEETERSPTQTGALEFDQLSSDEAMPWMESLAKRQGEADLEADDDPLPATAPAPKPAVDLPEWLTTAEPAPPAEAPLERSQPEPPVMMDSDEQQPNLQAKADEVVDWLKATLEAEPPPALDKPAPAPAAPPAFALAPAPPPTPSAAPEPQERIAQPATTLSTQSAAFIAYYPKEIERQQWRGLHAYVYRQTAGAQVAQDASRLLGEQLAGFRGVKAPSQLDIAEGASVTATPILPGFQFNPPSVTLGFYKDWHRFDFELRATTAPLNQAVNGAITFTVEGIIVADIPLSIFVGAVSSALQATPAVKLYHAIFCSYSHDDTQIIRRAESAYRALGLDYLRDVVSLKSGQHWSEELLSLIGKADIFQLFWSHSAAQSPYVRQEWEYALQYQDQKPNFIRPVYWQQPMPPTPPELQAIHFAYQPDLEE